MSTSQSYRSLSTDWHDELLGGFSRGALATPTEYQIGLFQNATDDLGEGADVGDITTEPSAGNYERQAIGAQELTTQRVDGALRLTAPEITFNTVGTGQDVDSWFATTAFDYAGQQSDPETHLIIYGALTPGGDRSAPSDGSYYTVPLERPDRYILTDVHWSHDTSEAGAV